MSDFIPKCKKPAAIYQISRIGLVVSLVVGFLACSELSKLDIRSEISNIYSVLATKSKNTLTVTWTAYAGSDLDFYLVTLESEENFEAHKIKNEEINVINGIARKDFSVISGNYAVTVDIIKKDKIKEHIGITKESVNIATLAKAPGSVVGLNADTEVVSSSTANITVKWTAPLNLGTLNDGQGAGVEFYTMYWKKIGKDDEDVVDLLDYEGKLKVRKGEDSGTIEALEIETMYSIIVGITNSAGLESISDALRVKSAASYAEAPTEPELIQIDSTGTKNEAIVELAWNSPDDAGKLYDGKTIADITGYRIYWKQGTTVSKKDKDVNTLLIEKAVTKASIGELAHGESYAFILTAINSAGSESRASTVKVARTVLETLAEQPAPIVNFRTSIEADTMNIKLSWNEAVDFGKDAEGQKSFFEKYLIYWAEGKKVDRNSPYMISVENKDASSITIPAERSSFKGNTYYSVGIIVENKEGLLSKMTTSNIDMPNLSQVPEDIMPTLSYVVDTHTAGSIVVEWNVPFAGRTAEGLKGSIEYYILYWQKGVTISETSDGWSRIESSGEEEGALLQKTIGGLTLGTRYAVSIIAVSNVGLRSTERVKTVLIAESQELGPAAFALEYTALSTNKGSSIELVWGSPNAGMEADGSAATMEKYMIYWNEGNRVSESVNVGSGEISPEETGAFIDFLKHSARYAVMVVAHSSTGRSKESKIAIIDTPPPTEAKDPAPVLDFTATASDDLSSKSIELNWITPVHFGQYEIGLPAVLEEYLIYINEGRVLAKNFDFSRASFSGGKETSFIINAQNWNALQGNYEYTVAVVVVNNVGLRSEVATATVTTNNLSTPPELAGDLQIDSEHRAINQMKLTWFAAVDGKNENGDAVNTDYVLYYGKSSENYVDAESLLQSAIALKNTIYLYTGKGARETETETLSYVLSNLEPNILYDVLLVAVNREVPMKLNKGDIKRKLRSNGVSQLYLKKADGITDAEMNIETMVDENLEFTVDFEFYNIKNEELFWKSSEQSVASIEPSSDTRAATVRLHAGGTVEITVQSNSDAEKQDSVILKVKKLELSNYALSYGTELQKVALEIGQTFAVDDVETSIPGDADIDYSYTPQISGISVGSDGSINVSALSAALGIHTLTVEARAKDTDRRYTGTTAVQVVIEVVGAEGPDPVSNIKVEPVENTKNLKVTWTLPSYYGQNGKGNAAAFKEVKVHYATSKPAINGQYEIAKTSPHTLSNLDGATDYWLAVEVVNSNGWGTVESLLSVVRTYSLATAPGPASNIEADLEHKAIQQIKITWSASSTGMNANGNVANTNYELYYGKSDETYVDAETLIQAAGTQKKNITGTGSGVQTHILENLESNILYDVALLSVNREVSEKRGKAVLKRGLRSNGVSQVNLKEADGITDAGTSIEKVVDEILELKASLEFYNIENEEFIWTSSLQDIASIEPSSDTRSAAIRMRQGGTTEITVKSKVDIKKQDSILLKVNKLELSSYTLSYGTGPLKASKMTAETIPIVSTGTSIPSDAKINYSLAPSILGISIGDDGSINISTEAIVGNYALTVEARAKDTDGRYTGSTTAQVEIEVLLTEAPDPVTNLQAEAVEGTKNLKISWTLPTSYGTDSEGNAATLKETRVYYASSRPATNGQYKVAPGSPYILDVLDGATDYWIAVEVVNNIDLSETVSLPAAVSTNDLARPPDPVSSIQEVSHAVINELKIEWPAVNKGKNSNGEETANQYELYYALSDHNYQTAQDIVDNGEKVIVNEASGVTQSYTITELQGADFYDLVIVVVNSELPNMKSAPYRQDSLRATGVRKNSITFRNSNWDPIVGNSVVRTIAQQASFRLWVNMVAHNVYTNTRWVSNNEEVAIVAYETLGSLMQEVTLLTTGTAVITVTSVTDPQVFAMLTVTLENEDISTTDSSLNYGETSFDVTAGRTKEILPQEGLPLTIDFSYEMELVPDDGSITIDASSGKITVSDSAVAGERYIATAIAKVDETHPQYKGTLTSEISINVYAVANTVEGVIMAGTVPGDLSAYNTVAQQIFERFEAGATIVSQYIKPSASGVGDGSSWGNAITITNALKIITYPSTDEVFLFLLASNTYNPPSVVMKNQLAIIGGWNAAEDGDLTRAGSTIIDGNNSKMVFKNYNNNLGPTALLYGVTITHGNTGQKGGGMYNYNSSPTLINVDFIDNNAYYGGGMYNYNATPTLINVTFSENTAGRYGAGICNDQNSVVTLNNVHFSSNRAQYGGAIYNYRGSSAILNDVSFFENIGSQGENDVHNQ